jgi:hypothetical protein
MIRYNILKLINHIDDRNLFESVYAGVTAIYENASTITIDEVEHITYSESLQLMDDHFSKITNKSQYSADLEHIAMDIFHRYQQHQKNIIPELDNLDYYELDLINKTVIELINKLPGNNTYEDYTNILKNRTPIYLDIFGTPERMTQIFNEFIESEKFNYLFHRVKDRFIPQMNKLN